MTDRLAGTPGSPVRVSPDIIHPVNVHHQEGNGGKAVARYQWIEPAPADWAHTLCEDFLLGEILWRRGFRDRAAVDAFLRPRLDDLPDPHALPDLTAAVSLIRDTIAAGRPIVVYGDYDADGLCGTALLTRALTALGAEVRTMVPNRLTDGYGLNLNAARRIAADGAGLAILVDCGTGDAEALRLLQAAGIPAVVLDHHHVRDPNLPAAAFVSPRRPDSQYPFAGLAAAGVTYQLARALLGEERAAGLLPLAALATVADVVPLERDNRAIVHHGLRRFAADAPLGLQVLCVDAGVDARSLTAWHLAFILAPRVNSAGRMEDPTLALRLLLTEDPAEARRLARYLSRLNAQRQQATERMLAQAERRLALGTDDNASVLLVAEEGWSVGLVGLVASRLADRYQRPAVVLARDGELSRGSARSIDGFDIVEALDACRNLLVAHGGHSRAAGLTVETAHLRTLEERLSSLIGRTFPDGLPLPALQLDAELHANELVPETARLIEALEPCGTGNPTPVFFIRDVSVQRPRLSRDGKHLLFDVVARDHRIVRRVGAVSFNGSERLDELAALRRADVAFTLRRDRWNGSERLSLEVVDFRPATARH